MKTVATMDCARDDVSVSRLVVEMESCSVAMKVDSKAEHLDDAMADGLNDD